MINVDQIQAPMVATHESGENNSFEWRIRNLKLLKKVVLENKTKFRDVSCEDLGRHEVEAIFVEFNFFCMEIDTLISNLRKWMKPKTTATPAVIFPGSSKIEHKPLNSPGVLVIGPFNFPTLLTLKPAAGAIAAGNPVVIKPSELCPKTSSLLKQLADEYFEPGVLQVIEGAIPETTALLEKPWGKIVFTGSERVGKIVATAAAKTLTPTVLELGGKCPVYVDETCPDISNVANRIIYGKTTNAGQICVAPDTLFVHENKADELCTELVKAIVTQFGNNPKQSEMSRIVSVPHTRRLVEMIQQAEELQCKFIYGSSKECDVDSKFICPTVVLNASKECRLMQEEIFGPILSIVTVSSKSQAIDSIKALPGTPLAMYIFTNKQSVFKEITDKCRSGAAVRNDIYVHVTNSCLPFGGLGTSGYGNYSGFHSFVTFSQAFPTVYRPLGAIHDFYNLRCHPHEGIKGDILLATKVLPNIPPLHLQKVLIFLFFIILIVLILTQSTIRMGLADGLENLATILRY